MHKDLVGNATNRGLAKTSALIIALFVLAFAAGCSKNANTGNSSNSSSSGSKSSNTTSTSSAQSPTEVFKAYYDAAVKKDFATAKGYLSQGTLNLMEEGAKKQGKTIDEALKDSPAVQGAMPQLSNEKITGDTATVDMMAEGQKVTMPFVKENGGWKIAMDKFLKEMMGGLKDSGPKAEDGDDKGEEGGHDGGH